MMRARFCFGLVVARTASALAAAPAAVKCRLWNSGT